MNDRKLKQVEADLQALRVRHASELVELSTMRDAHAAARETRRRLESENSDLRAELQAVQTLLRSAESEIARLSAPPTEPPPPEPMFHDPEAQGSNAERPPGV